MKYLVLLAILCSCVDKGPDPKLNKERFFHHCKNERPSGGPNYGRCDVNPCDINCYSPGYEYPKTKEELEQEEADEAMIYYLLLLGS
jgi:hypothetical protein